MDLIAARSELEENLSRFSGYLASAGVDRDFAVELLARGICFVIAETSSGVVFAPSRFVGYRDNNRHSHDHNASKDGRETNEALEIILGTLPDPDNELEHEYQAFCRSVGAELRDAPFNLRRKFWDLRRRVM